jgi:hypothetical protein
VGMITLPPSYPDYFETWEPQTLGILRAYRRLYRDCFNFC